MQAYIPITILLLLLLAAATVFFRVYDELCFNKNALNRRCRFTYCDKSLKGTVYDKSSEGENWYLVSGDDGYIYETHITEMKPIFFEL